MLIKNWRAHASRFFAAGSLAAAILAIGLNGEFSDPSHLPTKSKVAGRSAPVVSASKREFVAPPSLSSTPWLEKAASINSLEGLLEISTGRFERRLLQAMMDDELGNESPYKGLSSQYPLALVLAKGVKSFNRNTYRTSSFNGDEGYDLVVYEVIHTDGTHSSFMAYFDKDNREVLEGEIEPQKKALYVVFNVFETKHTSYYNRYKNGELEDHGSIELGAAMASVSQRVGGSIPFMAVSSR